MLLFVVFIDDSRFPFQGRLLLNVGMGPIRGQRALLLLRKVRESVRELARIVHLLVVLDDILDHLVGGRLGLSFIEEQRFDVVLLYNMARDRLPSFS